MKEAVLSFGEAFRLAVERYQTGDFARAAQICRQLESAQPDNSAIHHLLGLVLLEAGQFGEAEARLRRALELEPESAQLAVSLARLLYQKGDLESALATAERGLELDDENAEAHLIRGHVLRRREQHQDAVGAFRRASQLAPDFLDARGALGAALVAVGEVEEAVETLKPLVEQRPDRADLWVGLGNALLASGEHARAIAAYRKAIDLDPALPEAYEQLARALRLRAQAPAPEAGADRAGPPTPSGDEAGGAPDEAAPGADGPDDDPDALVARAKACAARQDAAGAARNYRRALALDPGHHQLHYDLGAALEHLGRNVEAADAYFQVLEHDPNDIYAKWRLQLLNMRSVARWHYPMLHDHERNDLYDQAIRNVVEPGSLVLDIGTGSGLLSMMAARAGAGHVVACEVVDLLADIARRVIAKNGLSDQITVINKKSTDLVVGVDLPRRADLLISELVSAGLLGEGHYPSIQHAAEHLLVPGARMIPKSAMTMGILLESQPLVDLERVETASGFDIRDFNRASLPSYVPRRLSLHEYTQLTELFDILEFDLTDKDLSDQEWTLDVPITRDGTCQGIAYWFDMLLDDVTHINNGPHQEASHWVQAVQLLPPRQVKEGETVQLVGRHNTIHIVFSWD